MKKKNKPTEETVAPSAPKQSDSGIVVRPNAQQIDAASADIVAKLAALGGSPAEVAAVLAAAEIVGERNDDHCCPVANYLKKNAKLPRHSYISVQASVVNLLEHMAGDPLCSVPIPKGVQKFIEAWDGGKYKKLADVN